MDEELGRRFGIGKKGGPEGVALELLEGTMVAGKSISTHHADGEN